MSERYQHVNGAWPVSRDQLPALTFSQARRVYRVLWDLKVREWDADHRATVYYPPMRHRRPWSRVTEVSGRLYNWPRRGTLHLNPGRGWWHLIHDLSHRLTRHFYPNVRPHSPQHHWIERTLVEEVVRRGWIDRAPS